MEYKAVRVEITHVVDLDNPYPEFVECRLVDAAGRQLFFHEKAPVVSDAHLSRDSTLPRPGIIAGRVVGNRIGPNGRDIIRLDTTLPWGIETTTGECCFEVFVEDLMDYGSQSSVTI